MSGGRCDILGVILYNYLIFTIIKKQKLYVFFNFGAYETPKRLVEVAEPLARPVFSWISNLSRRSLEKCGEKHVDFFVMSKEVES